MSKSENPIRLPIQVVIDAVESASELWTQYLDIESMKVVFLPEEPLLMPDEKAEEEKFETIENGLRTRFFRLPTKYDIHEYSIMERFIWSLPEGSAQDSLDCAIRGRGAFRRFKDGIRRLGIEQDWYDFQARAYRKIAIAWCEEQGFRYRDSGGDASDTAADNP